MSVVGAMLLLVATGCTKRDDTPFGLSGDAQVRLSLGVDNIENEQAIGSSSAGKAIAAPMPDPHKDLAIYIINTNKDTLARWACFNDAPATLKFTPGAYKIVAEYKPDGAKIPAFDTYIYRAEEKFVIKTGDDLHIDLTAKLSTAKISVEFDPTFDFFYQSYSVDIRTVGKDSLLFAKGETRCGFFEPGSVRMKFNLITREGQILTFSPEPLAKANAADYYKLKLKVTSDQGSTIIIIQGTRDELNEPKDTAILVPQYFLPKDKPAVTLKGFTNGVEKSVFEGEEPVWSVAANVPAGISSFRVRFHEGANDRLIAMLGGEREVDLASLPEDHQFRKALKTAGFVWSESLNSPEDASISTNLLFDFSEAMQAQADGSAAKYDFSIEVRDNLDQTPEADHPCNVKAEIRSSVVTFIQPQPGNAWATKAEFIVKANYDLNTGARPMLQYRRTTSTEWNDTEAGSDVIFTPQPQEGSDYVMQYTLKGLQPRTDYLFRIVAMGEASPEYGLTTENATALPNSDFSAYREEPALYGTKLFFDDWATRNPASAGQEKAENRNATALTCQNSTYRETIDGVEWLCMKTCYWGRAEEKKYISGKWYEWVDGKPKNITAGILYLGSYQYSLEQKSDKSGLWQFLWEELTAETLDRGRAFDSRPAALKLTYIFLPKKDDPNRDFAHISISIMGMVDGVETEIGNGKFKPDPSDAEAEKGNHGSVIALDVPITYSRTDVKASKINVFFSSSEAQWPEQPACHGEEHIGNVLKIKDVRLDYEF